MLTFTIIYLPSRSAETVLRENPEFALKRIHIPLECSEPWEYIICPPHSADHMSRRLPWKKFPEDSTMLFFDS